MAKKSLVGSKQNHIEFSSSFPGKKENPNESFSQKQNCSIKQLAFPIVISALKTEKNFYLPKHLHLKLWALLRSWTFFNWGYRSLLYFYVLFYHRFLLISLITKKTKTVYQKITAIFIKSDPWDWQPSTSTWLLFAINEFVFP